MQYAELIQFESLETVIEICDANHSDKAKQLVSSYVISDEMAFRLINLVFLQLQLDQLSDHKGLLIVGNYGTGKSHLMAVLSSIAEHADLLEALHHQRVAHAAQSIAGKFKVLRIEIGATTKSLRDIVTQELEQYLAQISVHFQFPAADMITNNKGAFSDMMEAFKAKYPEHGLLLVVDELLEYLRSRKDQELILDLNFLREIGEVCKELHFRFIAGLQETIFENQRFEFVSHSLRRVKDRFEQILITRKDIKFVLAERLLKKSDSQKSKIEAYLQPFTAAYSNMNERMSEFVDLFPIHPDYIDAFERITIIEKREILKTLERGVHSLVDRTIPEAYPGILAYDHYWTTLQENPSFRSIPEVREVIECSHVLEGRIEQAFTRPAYKPMALRIIYALSVHRLTTYDISAPVGVTAQELRDSLCLYHASITELGGHSTDDLLSLIEMVLNEILTTVNRQFISTNPNNGQYYIDFKKNYDFEGIIEKRAESLDSHQLDRYYYTALRQVMEMSDIPSGRMQSFSWVYELEWRSHRVTRQGYLVFGTQTTSTRDKSFLLYFLPRYQTSLHVASYHNEVFFRLKETDNKFDQLLRLYTAASDLSSTSSGHAKSIYESKSKIFLRDVVQWLQEQKATAFEVSYQGKTQVLIDCLNNRLQHEDLSVKNDPALFTPHPSLMTNFRDLIDLVADICLEPYFSELTPDYPVFSILISHENLAQTAQEALRCIARKTRSQQARSLFDALGLLREDKIDPAQSKYAQSILNQLLQKPEGHVLNKQELLPEAGNTLYHLEPELMMVLIATMIYNGDLVLVNSKQHFDTTNFAIFASTAIKDLLDFRHLERPKAFNLPALKSLVELLSLPTRLALSLTQKEDIAVQQLQSKVNDTLQQLVRAQQGLSTGFLFWGKTILSQVESQHYRDGLLDSKTFLESLHAYSTPLKFKNFPYSAGEVTSQWSGLKILQNVINLMTVLTDLSQASAYLIIAEATLVPQHAWVSEMHQMREQLIIGLSDVRQRNSTGFSYHAQQQLKGVHKKYIQAYMQLHQQGRLGAEDAQKKQALLSDQRLFNLKKLSKITLLPHQQLIDFEQRLYRLQSCHALSDKDLMIQPLCPHCGYKPISEPLIQEKILQQFEKHLAQIYNSWTKSLLDELEQADIPEDLLKTETRLELETFLTRRSLPNEITQEFVEAIQEGLSGLVKISVSLNDLEHLLLAGGAAMTVPEMQQRFTHYLNTLTQGQKLHLVRLVVE